ncbi:ATP-dependent zinc metalloprotease FTSH 12, chloroplastic isoform X2 [Pyrus x bretschneideri]|uniref:ATP-dependent zinc metalloprotease FTSH 12, chloroplastic isoform X2 n=1 Tax=Pyrus x bretschneideri TaxID=225117 RepID=UPI00202F4247|nr:ATP-dependent zinc metalloprotease FTSH 12, chloroplastic isoform X2 [Pyrus x bretschneideri]
MDLQITFKSNPLLVSSTPFSHTSPRPLLFNLPTKHRPKISRQKPTFRVMASVNSNGPDRFSWQSLTRSIRRGSERFWSDFGESVKKETGFDLKEANVTVGDFVGRVGDGLKKGGTELERFRTELLPEFVSWNRWERWKDLKTWESKRVAALIFYVFITLVSCQRIYIAIRAPLQNRQRKELTEAYMEAVIPEPSPINVRRFKKGMWRKMTPKGLKMKKFVEGPDGTLVHDSSYVGEDAWDDDPQPPQENVKQIIDSNVKLNPEEKKELEEDLGISGQVQEDSGTWRERLQKWNVILQKEKLAEQLDSAKSKYVVEFDMKEVENSLRKDVVEKVTETQGTRALWIAKRWWLYRPRLPYTYFLQKLDCSEVAAVVFTEDLKRIYVTMKEGFPLEYVPVGDVGETKSMSKEVVLGGDVWDLLDELMVYMGNPMQYYEREVKFVRGVLLSGPPGTGKTLFARTLAKESGMPFVFASGAEFTDSEKSGAARINEMFSIARRNAPSFVFVDEIDAIAGRHARLDPRRRATFEALIAQLDGEKEKTGVDRFSLRQAVIFICATNRPDELDLEFVRPGRIDRRLYIGLPDAKQRVQIFGVHSAGKQLAEDVDFGKLVFRTVGFSGADIRNLVNEAAIMSVRKGRSKIYQEDIVDVLDKQLLEGMGVLLTEEEQRKCEQSVSSEKKKLLAVHEAGHIVLAHLFPQFDWHAFSQLLPGGKETAISVFFPREDMVDQGYTTFGYMMMQMVVAHGGRCAERVVFGDDITDGGRDDLEKITKIAREMVISPQNSRLGLTSLTKRVGLVDRPDSPDGELIRYRWDDPHVIPANMTLEVSELFTRELTRYIEETEELAMNGLRNNRHILDMIIKELLEKSRITGLEVEEKIKDLSPVMFEDFVKPFQIDLEKDGPLPHNDQLRYKPLDIYPAPLHRC